MFDKVAVVGGGVIGAGWAARFALGGLDVVICDPQKAAHERFERVLEAARTAWQCLGLLEGRGREGRVVFASEIDTALSDVQLVVEAVPERVDIKQQVYAHIEAVVGHDVPIATSTSGLLPSELQSGMKNPERLLVAHPFNPVYLLPLVEMVAGKQTDKTVMETVSRFLSGLHMKPLVVRKEIDAFIADRLLEAVWRESLWLVHDGVATTREIDDAIRYGFGLRWAQMGIFETYRIAGGDAGMRHFLAQFGPSLKWPWTKLMDVPELDDDLVSRVATQSDDQSGNHSISELEAIRDKNLVDILKVLRANQWGAGTVF